MTAALLNVCVDPRLNHEALRHQLRQRVGEQGTLPERVFVVSDVGGNIGSAARNTLSLLRRQRDRVLIVGVLHHDDCLAHAAGMRQPMESSVRALRDELKSAGFEAPVLWGTIVTQTSTIVWADRPPRSLEVIPFRMPRMYG